MYSDPENGGGFAQNEKIHLYTYSEVEKVSGFVGDFTVNIRKKARSVDDV